MEIEKLRYKCFKLKNFEHLKEKKISYCNYMIQAFWIAGKLLLGVPKLIIHGFYPDWSKADPLIRPVLPWFLPVQVPEESLYLLQRNYSRNSTGSGSHARYPMQPARAMPFFHYVSTDPGCQSALYILTHY